MFNSKIMVIYRIFALLILTMPIAVNIYIKGDIVSSIIYTPLILLGLSGIAIFIDGKLEGLLNAGMVLPKFKMPNTAVHIKTANNCVLAKLI